MSQLLQPSAALPSELYLASSSPSAPMPTARDYQATLAAAGYNSGFVERCARLRDGRSNSNESTSSSLWSNASSLVRPPTSRRQSARQSTVSSQAVVEELLDAALAVEQLSVSSPTVRTTKLAARPTVSSSSTSSPTPSRPSSVVVPRPLSLAESTRSVLLAAPSTSPTPSFMSALSAGEYHRNRDRRQQHDAPKRPTSRDSGIEFDPMPPPSSHAGAPLRRSMSPVVSVTSSSNHAGSARPYAHWRSRTLSPAPPSAGPPPTGPLPPTPTGATLPLTPTGPSVKRASASTQKRASTASPRAPKAEADDIARQRAEARAALEGRSYLGQFRLPI